jgi:2-phosphosulfolactate phosphatase
MSRFVDSDPPPLRGDNPPRSVEVVCGAGGCRAAVEAAGVAVMVDALRASATITALIAAGARRVWVATEIEQAHAMKARLVQEGIGEPILLGEREGFPPPGFDAGNSPRDAMALPINGRDAVFTSTTGSARLGQLEGTSLAVVGSTVNADRVARIVAERAGDRPVFAIAAGLRGAPGGTEEDWIGAAVIAERLTEHDFEWVNRGLGARGYWPATLDAESVLDGFTAGAHGRVLAGKGLGADVEDCARIDWIDAVAQVVGYLPIDEGPPIAELARLV